MYIYIYICMYIVSPHNVSPRALGAEPSGCVPYRET